MSQREAPFIASLPTAPAAALQMDPHFHSDCPICQTFVVIVSLTSNYVRPTHHHQEEDEMKLEHQPSAIHFQSHLIGNE